MSFIEVESFLEGLNRRNRESWEQARLLGYIIAQANSTKTLKTTDIMHFSWDDDEPEKKDTHVSDVDVKRLREKAKAVETQLKTQENV